MQLDSQNAARAGGLIMDACTLGNGKDVFGQQTALGINQVIHITGRY